jgi:hypothetical protein
LLKSLPDYRPEIEREKSYFNKLLTPYAEFLVGLARYRASNKPGAENTTDDQWQAIAGVAKRLTPRFDIAV